MGRRVAGLLGGLILACTSALAGAATDLPAALDLRAEAQEAAAAGLPLIVIYSRKDCKYCETVKRDYLKPLAGKPQAPDKVFIRQINQDSEQPLSDFKGKASTHAKLAASEKIKLVPVVAFSPAYVRAGAILALYQTPSQVGVQAAGLLGEVLRHKKLLSAPVDSSDFEIAFNAQVSAALGLTIDPQLLRNALRQQEGQP